METKFSIEALNDFTEKLNEMHSLEWHISQQQLQKNDLSDVFTAFDYTTRVAAMLNSIITQQLEGEIITADPQDYIKSNLGTAYSCIKRLEKKYPR